jgi:murein DD-endopeptidase MepM/ murein hydrolase activator NlpD
MGTLSAKLRANHKRRIEMNFAHIRIALQKAAYTPRGGWRGWIVAGATLPFFGVLGAFGTAPDTLTQTIETRPVVEVISLPDMAALSDGQEPLWREERIRRGDTLASLLARMQVSDPTANEYLRKSKDAKGIMQLAPGRTIQVLTSDSGHLISLRYRSGADKELVVKRGSETFTTRTETVALERRLLMKSGSVVSSLYAATDDADVPEAVTDQLLKVFSSEIDFRGDLRRGDRFAVVFEAFYRGGEMVRSGRLMAAEFANGGKTHRAVWFEGSQGKGDYYAPDGKSLKKGYLRSPIEISRVTSGFSEARLHPVLQTVRAHKGVDYAAPIGTKVLAAADGTVEFVGQQSGYGNVIIVEHRDGISTLYGHLSAFRSGLQKGQSVEQGDVIGYVGMTGLATGPHLHYEFRINGEHQDPLRVAAVGGFAVSPQWQAEFETRIQPLAQQLSLLRGTNLARLE